MTAAQQATRSSGTAIGNRQQWFGLVRAPVEGVEILPVVWTQEAGVLTLEEFARTLVMAHSNVTQAELGEQMDPNDRVRDVRLEDCHYHYTSLSEDLDALSEASLACLLEEFERLCQRVSHEWLSRIGSGSALTTAWYLQNRYTGWTTRLPVSVSDRVTEFWRLCAEASCEREQPRLAINECFDGQPDIVELRVAVYSLIAGLASVASTALNTGNQHGLDCLDHPPEGHGPGPLQRVPSRP